jgi:hypothetical protein
MRSKWLNSEELRQFDLKYAEKQQDNEAYKIEP